MKSLPFVTPELPGFAGSVRRADADFVVEEVPLYAASGDGEHVYFTIRRSGRTTDEVGLAIAEAFGLRARDVGFAGMKDKHAVTTQRFSLHLPSADLDEAAARVRDHADVEVLAVARHPHKLKRGHLLANRFDIRVRDVTPDSVERARAIAAQLARVGLPNYFGPQRFGDRGRNVERGRELVRGERSALQTAWAGRMLGSAFQADLFNTWLAERIDAQLFRTLERGDVARKTSNGALFGVEDIAAEQARLERGEIAISGPIYGARMRQASGAPAARERALLERAGVALEDFATARLDGDRRAAGVAVQDLETEGEDGALRLRFTLPKGSFATALLREMMKDDALVE